MRGAWCVPAQAKRAPSSPATLGGELLSVWLARGRRHGRASFHLSAPSRYTARRAGEGRTPGATAPSRPPPPPLLPPFAEVLSTVSTQPTTLPASRYTSTRFPNPQRGLPEGWRPNDHPR